ncbi:SDR family oxidoreductase [Streptomyces sp. NBC_01707]|uniref:SDR family NAD(P)-dependent oxidoreductase n=1 Tax=unclassified Streptomyces TaxID=2593676 RepID=UPI0029A6D5CA|nr:MULTISPECIES: SDR family oxidoreductase [unclassified Streptomyces]MDX3771786.1 SDR family oxidoreductase [Streptomyces sp. AK08-01B]MDX3821338.1 SDR family oxidoreductase [Streptomyces sp. AK08-01A]
MSNRLQSKVIIVTGGTSGMGSAFARRAASEGATVLIGARDKERGEATVAEIAREGGKALFVPTDVTVEEEIAHLVDVAVKEFGGLHGAFNNAGGGNIQGTIRNTEASFWDRVIALNLTSVFYSLKHEIPAIVASGGGSIVNNASVVGVAGDPTAVAYAAAKHGVVGLTRSAALDAAKEGVRVNALVTGLVNTPLWQGFSAGNPEAASSLLNQQPTGRAADEAEIAAFTTFLLSDESPFITGAALAIDGALTAGY